MPVLPQATSARHAKRREPTQFRSRRRVPAHAIDLNSAQPVVLCLPNTEVLACSPGADFQLTTLCVATLVAWHTWHRPVRAVCLRCGRSACPPVTLQTLLMAQP